MDPDDSDSPWQDNAESLRDTEWSKISADFLNVGYREGIIAGKETALQEGFDEGFAQTGAPIGHRLGMHRGATAAILAMLSSRSAIGSIGTDSRVLALDEARTILAALADVRVADIAPPDVQAVEHAEEHLKAAEEAVLPGAPREKSDMEGLESMMARMEATPNDAGQAEHRSSIEQVETLFSRFHLLADTLGLSCPEIQ